MPHPLDADWNLVDCRKKHLLAVGWRRGSAKLCVVQFHKEGFFVHFPFHPNEPGVIARCALVAGSAKLDLTEQGGVVSHRVKYSHHGDGTCLFSQDTKIRSVTKTKQGAPLLGRSSDRSDHLFSIEVEGLEHFPELSEAERCSDTIGRGFVEFAADDPPMVHVVARWRKIEPTSSIATMRNPIMGRLPTGEIRPMLGLSPPEGSPLYGHIMAIDVRTRRRLDPSANFLLLFTGGFGASLGDVGTDSSALAMMYPASNLDALQSFDL